MNKAVKRISKLGTALAMLACAATGFANQQHKPVATTHSAALMPIGKQAADYVAWHRDMVGSPLLADVTVMPAAAPIVSGADTASCHERKDAYARRLQFIDGFQGSAE